jgi:hypothetical protein
MYRKLSGLFGYKSGTAATVTVPKGAVVLQIVVHATASAATVVIFGGTSIPIIAGAPPTQLLFQHDMLQSQNDTTTSGSQDIVFVNTDSYYVDWIVQR